ncbi:MAG: peptidase MA family metallohydrolase [Pirellulales bacterium]
MARWAPLARTWLVLAPALVGALGMLSTGRSDARALAACPNCSRSIPATWHVVETANFRILSFGTHPVSPETARACESLRGQLARQWLADDPKPWSPKCDVVLQPTDEAYLREVGGGGRNTVASALIDRRDSRICRRRIDVRASGSDWQTLALAHELAHVVLADRFVHQALPRWVDEGMAILADPPEKRERHERALKRAVARGAQFRLAELLALADYPAADRWGTFYGQSASLVEYLVAQQGHGRFVEFVDLALEHGYENALRRVYSVGIGELERRWHRTLTAADSAAGAEAPNHRAASSVSSSAG